MNRMTYATACYTALLWQPPAPLRILKYGLAVQKKEELKKKEKKKDLSSSGLVMTFNGSKST